MCGQHNVKASAEDNTDKGHTPNSRSEIKIPHPAGNRTRAALLEGRDSTDDATATDLLEFPGFIFDGKIYFFLPALQQTGMHLYIKLYKLSLP